MPSIDPRVVATVTLLCVLGLVAIIGRRLVAQLDLRPEQRQRTRNMVRYGVFLTSLISMVVVWVDVVNDAALLASGFAVALVLFNKDLILNLLGWWQKTASGAYRIGDRVRVGRFRGDVLDYGILSTTLMQVDAEATHGMRTGNVVVLPNMMLLTEPVINETLVLAYEWKEYRFVVDASSRVAAERVILEAAQQCLGPYEEEVRDSLQKMSQAFAFRAIAVKPRVFVEASASGEVVLTLRLATPARALRETQDALNRAFLEWREGERGGDERQQVAPEDD